MDGDTRRWSVLGSDAQLPRLKLGVKQPATTTLRRERDPQFLLAEPFATVRLGRRVSRF
jgi:hypothetical protein